MKRLTIIYSGSSEARKEAYEMSEFLRENGVSCTISGFTYERGGARDMVLDMACVAPLINAQILSTGSPPSRYVKGLKETKKHIEQIKKYVESQQAKARFYSGGTEDDKKALQLLMEANVPYINFGPTSEIEPPLTPYIKYRHWVFWGLKGIKSFIKNNWRTGKLPPLGL